MDTILSVILLMLYVIVAGWTAGFHAIRTSGGLSVYAASDRLSAHALGMSAFSSELGIWLMLAPFLSIFRSFGLLSSYSALAAAGAGFFLSWCLLAQKMRIYNEISEPSRTVPSFLARRLKGGTESVRISFGASGAVFCLLYAAAAISMAATLMQWMFGINYTLCVTAAAILAAAYTIAGGFDSTVNSGITKAILVTAVLAVSCISVYLSSQTAAGGRDLITLIGGAVRPQGSWSGALSAAAIGLTFFGSPSLLRRFMALRRRRDVFSARRAALTLMCIGVLLCAAVCTVAAVGGISVSDGQTAYSLLYMLLRYPLIQAFVTTGALIILIHSAAVQIHMSAGMLSEDCIHTIYPPRIKAKRKALADTLILAVVTLLAAIAAGFCSNGISLLIYAASGLTAVFAPTVIGCMFCTGITVKGAVASAVAGLLSATAAACFIPGPAGIAVCTAVSAVTLTVVCLCTKNPYTSQIKSEYERVSLIRKCKGRIFR